MNLDTIFSNSELLARVAELETLCAQAYIVVGVLADKADVFDATAVEKALDNFSQAKLVHVDVIPFELEAGK